MIVFFNNNSGIRLCIKMYQCITNNNGLRFNSYQSECILTSRNSMLIAF